MLEFSRAKFEGTPLYIFSSNNLKMYSFGKRLTGNKIFSGTINSLLSFRVFDFHKEKTEENRRPRDIGLVFVYDCACGHNINLEHKTL